MTPAEQLDAPGLYDLLATVDDEKTLFIRPGLPDYSYGDLKRESARLAQLLHAQGIGRGDSIALSLGNEPQWMVVAFAAWRLGAALLALNPRFGAREIGDLISRTNSKALFLAPGYRGGATADALRRVPAAQRASLQLIISCDDVSAEGLVPGLPALSLNDLPQGTPVDVIARPDDACLYMATSGTTSLPKIVHHRQDRVFRHCRNAAQIIGYEADSRVLLAIPFCGGYGFAVAMTAIAAAIPIVLMDVFEPNEAARLINGLGVTHTMGTNDMLHKLLQVTPGERPFPGLKAFGHANFTPGLDELPEEAERRGVRMRGFYGLSETLAFVAARSLDASLEERAAGGGQLTTPEAKLRIADPETNLEQPFGVAGEIQIKSPNVMVGYLNDRERTDAAFTTDGYFRTGDLGLRDSDDGFTFITRMNDILRIGGYLVAPEEIEDVIKADPAVEQCQVVAVTLDKGPRPVAFIVPAKGMKPDADALIERCRAQLAIYKVPVQIFELDAVPVIDGPNGQKVQKNVLRDMAHDMARDMAREKLAK